MLKRRRLKSPDKFQQRLARFAKDRRKEASAMPPGPERNDLFQKASGADDAAHLDDWARSLFSELGSP
jgi:hypothetical protein